MDIFGALWADHPARLAESWDRVVRDNDVVLIAGDISWARRLSEAAPDLAYLAARRGRMKLLLRGNHDSWWDSPARVRAALPPGLAILQNDAIRLPEGVVVCGARGWNSPGAPWGDPAKDPPIYRRELERLELSLSQARILRQPGDILVSLLHFPPLDPGESGSEVLRRLGDAGVAVAVYGHLHGADHEWAPRGRFGSVEVRFVAADFLGFTPELILERD
jgi:hypothetical protein